MRVVAGELGGRRLISPRGEATRPTSDRVREALFSILGDVSGLTVLDLFAGTGALAIEALSRGSASAVLVDRDVGAAEANVEALGVDDRAEVVRADVARFLTGEEREFDLVFCDPPYRLARRLTSELDTLVPDALSPTGRLVVECSATGPLDLGLPLIDERVYGSTMIRIHGSDR